MKITITKIDSAKVQIETAIRLFFYDDSAVSVHTLASAALGIIKDFRGNRNGNVVRELEQWIKPEYIAEWRKKFNEPANYLKHSDRDSHETMTFDEEINDMKLLLCCMGYREIGGVCSQIMNVFLAWIYARYPGMIYSEKTKVAAYQVDLTRHDRKAAKNLGKQML